MQMYGDATFMFKCAENSKNSQLLIENMAGGPYKRPEVLNRKESAVRRGQKQQVFF